MPTVVTEDMLDPVPAPAAAPAWRTVTEADLDPAPKPPIGLVRAAGQGALQAATDIMRAIAFTPFGGAGLRVGAAIASGSPKPLGEGVRVGQEIDRFVEPAIQPTGTLGEAAVQGGVRGVLGTIPTLGMGTAAVPLSVAAGGVGGTTSEVAREMGAPPLVAAGLGALASMGVAAGGSGLAAVARGRRGLDRLGGREAAEIAAATELRGAIGADSVDDATRLLAAEDAAGSLPGRARTSQVLMDRAPGVVGLEASQARRFPALQSAAAERLRANENAINLAAENVQQGARDALVPAWQQAREASQGAVRAAYQAVDPTDVGPIPTAGIKAAAEKIVAEAGDELAGKLPGEVRLIGGYGDAVDFPTLQRLRTSLSDTARDLARTKPGSTDLRFATQLKGAVDDELTRLAESGAEAAPALRAAIATRAEHGRLYDLRHPAVKALSERENPEAVVQAVVGAKRPTEEARRVLAAVGRDTEGHEGLKRLWMDKALGGEALWDANPAKAVKWLRANEAASRQILGDEGHNLAVRLLERSRQLQYGRVGTPGMALGTGSALPSSGEAFDAASSALGSLIRGHPGQAASIAAGKAWDWLVTRTTSEQRAEILNEALMDPKRARELLTTITPERLARWKKSMEANIARTSARTAAQSTGGQE